MKRLLLISSLLASLVARAQLTVTVTPGYVFADNEKPTTAKLNLLGQPSLDIAGTISGTVGLGAGTITGVHFADSVVDGITIDFNGSSPRALEIKNGGVGPTQLNTSVAGTGLTGGGGSALSVDPLVVASQMNLVGAVTAYAGASSPSGWLECDGTAVSRTVYSNLFAAISTHWGVGNGTTTFNLPDLRGQFVRGYDHGAGVDSGRALYSSQTDDFKAHTHTVTLGTDTGTDTQNTLALQGDNSQTTIKTSSSTGGTETRPMNVTMLYVIRW